MNSDGDNNSLGSIASISKAGEMGGEKKQAQEQVKRQRKKNIWHQERDGRKETKLKWKEVSKNRKRWGYGITNKSSL